MYKSGNATTGDLFNILKIDWYKKWIEEKGFPLLIVKDEDDELILEQALFRPQMKIGNIEDGLVENFWQIPIKINWNGEIEYYFMKEKHLRIKKKSSKYAINHESVGFYRVMNTKLIKKLQSNKQQTVPEEVELENNMTKSGVVISESILNARNRLNVLNDVYALSYNNYTNLENFITLLEYYNNENNYDVLSSIFTKLLSLRNIFRNELFYEKALKFLKTDFKNMKDEEFYNQVSVEVLKMNLKASLLNVKSASFQELELQIEKLVDKVESENKINPNVSNSSNDTIILYQTARNIIEIRKNNVYDMNVYTKGSVGQKTSFIRSIGLVTDKNAYMGVIDLLLNTDDNKPSILVQDKVSVIWSLLNNYEFKEILISHFFKNFNDYEKAFNHNYVLLSYVIENMISQSNLDLDYNQFKREGLENALGRGIEKRTNRLNFIANNKSFVSN